ASRQREAEDHPPCCVRSDFHAALYDFPFRDRSICPDLPHAVRREWRPVASVVAWLQLQRGGLGRIHRLVRFAVETGVVMVVYLHEALDKRLRFGSQLTNELIEQAAVEGAVQRLRPKLMTVTAVLASLAPILWESGIGSDVM